MLLSQQLSPQLVGPPHRVLKFVNLDQILECFLTTCRSSSSSTVLMKPPFRNGLKAIVIRCELQKQAFATRGEPRKTRNKSAPEVARIKRTGDAMKNHSLRRASPAENRVMNEFRLITQEETNFSSYG